MVALVEPDKKIIVTTKEGTAFIWDYKEQKNIEINQELIPAISISNDPNNIDNKKAIAFPKDWGKVGDIQDSKQSTEEAKLKNLGRKDEADEYQEFNYQSNDDDEQSILVQKLRETIIRFEKLLTGYLDPDFPIGRKARKKYKEEMDHFRAIGYKDFINTIDLKVEALCSFEDYDLSQFCKESEKNWFKARIVKALSGDFYSAQEVVNSVMQIVKEEEYAVPKRRIVTKLR